ncbi:SDR family oxidoreductase [Deinococcus arenicola]|uniref:SDR family oxidoreductase n=1 Tax=Deinococcus arenicola TaxID=2994950 RepID=A0ABU4DTD8_9DEIO|nr:SDR family oxidoreductase [Deinococcus sp. ZS9-10]MDV6375701.1 SDR family oxidoreductase [Deinococcus sp. ZS9-10]
MKIAVIGAAGGVGRRVVAQAARAQHEVSALVRREEQADMVLLHGAKPVMGDLEGDWEAVLDGADAVVWAAGGGAGGNYQAIDGEALKRVADTLAGRGPKRLVVVSSMGVDRPDEMPPFLQQVLRVKANSDRHVQNSPLDWTIVRPGGLNDEPGSGQVALGMPAPRGSISRDDVAALVLACLNTPATVGKTFEAVAGNHGISEAIEGL